MELSGEHGTGSVIDRHGGGYARAGGYGIATIILVIILNHFFRIDAGALLGSLGSEPQVAQQPLRSVDPSPGPHTRQVSEMRQTLASMETAWNELFREMGGRYAAPKMVFFADKTPSGCGQGKAALGPFYCPADQSVYLDSRFFDDLERRMRSGGNLARSYVIAHAVGHHVQNLTGITKKTQALRARMTQKEYSQIAVRVELQADCFAGVWAHHANRARPFIAPGDIEEALNAVSAIGNDTLQRATRGTITPDSFTHGTATQRIHWLRTGFASGSVQACDTFSASL